MPENFIRHSLELHKLRGIEIPGDHRDPCRLGKPVGGEIFRHRPLFCGIEPGTHRFDLGRRHAHFPDPRRGSVRQIVQEQETELGLIADLQKLFHAGRAEIDHSGQGVFFDNPAYGFDLPFTQRSLLSQDTAGPLRSTLLMTD
ncbi:MAG: hypothetical protein ACOY3K_05110 [Candidatus Omnitrophota bacterium]